MYIYISNKISKSLIFSNMRDILLNKFLHVFNKKKS